MTVEYRVWTEEEEAAIDVLVRLIAAFGEAVDEAAARDEARASEEHPGDG